MDTSLPSGELILSDAVLENVGPAIRQLRRDRLMTMAQLAEKAGIDQGNLSRIENGKTKPTLETISRIAYAFGEMPYLFISALVRFSNVDQNEKIQDEIAESEGAGRQAFAYIHSFADPEADIDPRYGDYQYLRVLRDLPMAKWQKDDVLLVSPHEKPRSNDILIFEQNETVIAAKVTMMRFPPGWKGGAPLILNTEILAPFTATPMLREDAKPIGVVVELRRVLHRHHLESDLD